MEPNPGTYFTPAQEAMALSLTERLTNDSGGLLEEFDANELLDADTSELHQDLNPHSAKLWTEHLDQGKHDEEEHISCRTEYLAIQADIESFERRMTENLSSIKLEEHTLEVVMPVESHADESDEVERGTYDVIKDWLNDHPTFFTELQALGLAKSEPTYQALQQAVQNYDGLRSGRNELETQARTIRVKENHLRERLFTLSDNVSQHNRSLKEELSKLLIRANEVNVARAQLEYIKQEQAETLKNYATLEQNLETSKKMNDQTCGEKDTAVAQLAAARTDLETANTAKTNQDSRIQTIEGERDTAQQSSERLLQDLECRKEQLDSRNDTISGLEAKVSTMEQTRKEQTTKIQTEITRLEGQVNKGNESILELTNQKSKFETDLKTAKTDLGTASQNLIQLTADLKQAKERVDDAEAQLKSSRSDVTSLNTAGVSSLAKIKQFESDLEEQKSEVKKKDHLLNTEISRTVELETANKDLKDELDTAKQTIEQDARKVQTLEGDKTVAAQNYTNLVAEKQSFEQLAQKQTIELEGAQKSLRTAEELLGTKEKQIETLTASDYASKLALEASKLALEQSLTKVQTLEAAVPSQQATMTLSLQALSLGSGPVYLETVESGLWVAKDMAVHIGEGALQQPVLTVIHGLTADYGVGTAAVEQVHGLFMQAHSKSPRLSASSILCLAQKLATADAQCLRACIPSLFAVAVRLCSRTELSLSANIILLQILEMLASSLQGHQEAIAEITKHFALIAPPSDTAILLSFGQ